ncbi:MAG: hypothetical protein FJX76_18470 [Armatimonadetes bacterium]|nr:hypothetical protein [Armatimonadota bacterium]
MSPLAPPPTLEQINLMVENSRAVRHPLIKLLSHNPNNRHAWQVFAAHHHPIVREFPYHIQALFRRLDADTAQRLHPVLADEFDPGEMASANDAAPDFSAHARLQVALCHSLGTEPTVTSLPAVQTFIDEHRRISREAEVAFALGVFGPGHEAAVPMMFRQLVSGAPPYANPSYLFEHLTIDVIHAQCFADVLKDFDLFKVEAGAAWSLDLRARAWDAILEAI